MQLDYVVATAPTVYGIETECITHLHCPFTVATAPTVYGIETACKPRAKPPFFVPTLQQHLPFTVLKLS